MITIRNILCPYDGSEFSARALEQAVALARWYKAGITLVHATTGALLSIEASWSGRSTRLDPAERKRLAAWLADVGAPARAAGVGVDARVVEGIPATEILQLARDLPADLLVMGTHGRSGFNRLLLGSVTEKVLRHAPCPVLTVTGRAGAPAPADRPPFAAIVCPVDFSPSSLRAVEYSLSLAQEAYGKLTFVHAIDFPLQEEAAFARFDLAGYHKAVEEAARERLATILPVDARDWCKPEHVVSRGKPYRAILEAAEQRAADLIVIGIHGRTPVSLALFGSTTNHVVREAHCPVLVIRTGSHSA